MSAEGQDGDGGYSNAGGEFESRVDQAVEDSTRGRRCRSAGCIQAAIGWPLPRQRNRVDSVH